MEGKTFCAFDSELQSEARLSLIRRSSQSSELRGVSSWMSISRAPNLGLFSGIVWLSVFLSCHDVPQDPKNRTGIWVGPLTGKVIDFEFWPV